MTFVSPILLLVVVTREIHPKNISRALIRVTLDVHTLESSGGRANSYATDPRHRSISNGLVYLGLNFPLLPNLMTPLKGEIFRNT